MDTQELLDRKLEIFLASAEYIDANMETALSNYTRQKVTYLCKKRIGKEEEQSLRNLYSLYQTALLAKAHPTARKYIEAFEKDLGEILSKNK